MKTNILLAVLLAFGLGHAAETVAKAAPESVPSADTNAVANIAGDAKTDEIDLEEDDSAVAAQRPQVKSLPGNGSVSLVDIDCDDAPLADILRQFRKTTGANIISVDSTNLLRRVSVTLRHVPWQQALTAILGSRGFRLEEHEGIFRVVEDKQVIPLLTKTFQLNHASAKELAELFNSTYGKKDAQKKTVQQIATYFEGANVVVVTADEKTISDCESIIKAIDKAVAQIYIEARFLELSSEAMHKLGMQWDQLAEWGVTASAKAGWEANHGVAGVYSTDRKENWYTKKNMQKTGTSLSSSTTYQDLANGKSAVDYKGDDGKTLYFTPKDQTKTGENYNSADTYTDLADGKSGLDYITQNFLSPSSIGGAEGAGLSASDMAWQNAYGFSGQLTADNFRLALSAFEELGEGKIFSNPKIIVSNGKEAKVDMTTKEPNVAIEANYTGTSSQNLSISTKLEVIPGEDKQMFAKEAFFSYGIELSVKPRISPDGLISVEIVPTISEKTDEKKINGAGQSVYTTYPVISVKRLTTDFTMKDGSTAVIGGLTQTVEEDVDSGIPYLRKIPWIGPKLFGWKSRQKVQKEIIVCVTIGIANPAELPKDAGLPTNAVIGREYVNGTRLEPGKRNGNATQALKLDMRELDDEERVNEDARKIEIKKSE